MMHCNFAFVMQFHYCEIVGVFLRLGVDLLVVIYFVNIYSILLIIKFVDVALLVSGYGGLQCS